MNTIIAGALSISILFGFRCPLYRINDVVLDNVVCNKLHQCASNQILDLEGFGKVDAMITGRNLYDGLTVDVTTRMCANATSCNAKVAARH